MILKSKLDTQSSSNQPPMPRIPAILMLAATLAWATAAADDLDGTVAECRAPGAEVPLANELGSAGFMLNLAAHPDSITAIAGRLLEEALSDETVAATAECRPDCPAATVSEVVYRVAPTVFLAEGEQNAVCLRFERETEHAPLRFDTREFATVEALHEWIMDFSQGRGEDGRALYERCSSNCSPRYTFVIAERPDGYAVKTEVLCGLARDRAEDRYRISTALRRTCALN
jgi:hypothetical protein